MILGILLELVPYIGPATSLLGMVTDVVAEPSTGGGMGGIVTTVLFSHKVEPYMKKFFAWTSNPYDDKVGNFLSSLLGWVTQMLISLGKIDGKEIVQKVKSW